MRVLTLSGSLREGSLNTLLLRAAEEQLPAGVTVDRFDGLGSIPPFPGVYDGAAPPPPAVAEWFGRIEAADVILIATPEYNGSIPGVLKNALDWASRPHPENVLRGKPVAVIGASTGSYGGMWAQAELRKVLGIIGARPVDPQVPAPRAHELFDGETLTDDVLRRRLGQLTEALLGELQPLAA